MGNTVVLDIGGTNIKYGLINNETHILSNVQETSTDAMAGGQALMQKIIGLIKSFSGFNRIGISTCGQVDSHTNSIRFATDNIPGYTGVKVKEILEKEFQVSVTVENDVNAAALGEAYYGAAQEYENFLCVTYGTGIGGAIILNRRVFPGSQGSAGEFGHFITHKDGKPCTCGAQGCYEAYASTSVLTRLVKQELYYEMNGRDIFVALSNNNLEIKKIIDAWIDEVSVGLAGLTHIFNPECIILGGGIMSESYILNQLNINFKKYVMISFQNVKLIPAALGNSAGLMGVYYAANHIIK